MNSNGTKRLADTPANSNIPNVRAENRILTPIPALNSNAASSTMGNVNCHCAPGKNPLVTVTALMLSPGPGSTAARIKEASRNQIRFRCTHS